MPDPEFAGAGMCSSPRIVPHDAAVTTANGMFRKSRYNPQF